ncbi:MAG: hypothetical protein ACRDRH_00670 [Pseudonocardia sp.]
MDAEPPFTPTGAIGIGEAARRVALLDVQIARAQRARTMLLGARDCPEPEPVRDCPHLRAELDAVVAGVLTPAIRSPGGHVGAGT